MYFLTYSNHLLCYKIVQKLQIKETAERKPENTNLDNGYRVHNEFHEKKSLQYIGDVVGELLSVFIA